MPSKFSIIIPLAEGLRIVAISLAPFLMDTSQKIFDQLGIEDQLRDIKEREFGKLKGGRVKKGEPIFKRIDVEKELDDLEDINKKEETFNKGKKPEKQKLEVTYDEFGKLDLRVATVISCEQIKDSDKLYKLEVKMGGEVRQIVSGIRFAYGEEELIGKQVIVIANLKKAKIRGVESFGMLLAAGDGKDLTLLTTDKDLGDGIKVS